MKILHLTESYTPFGGIEQYVIALISLLEPDHSNFVAYCRDHPRTIKDGDCPALLLSTDVNYKSRSEKLLNLIKSEGIELVLVHNVDDPSIILGIEDHVPTLGYIHGFLPICPSHYKYFRRGDQICTLPFGFRCAPMMYLRRCSEALDPRTVKRLIQSAHTYREAYQSLKRVIVASNYMRNLLVQNGFKSEQIEVLPPHFDDPHTILKPQKDPPLILFVGRIEIEKGLPYLLEAMARIRLDYQLIIAGDGTRLEEYKNLARSLGIYDRVSFLGWLDQTSLYRWYQRATCLVVPSIYPEPFGKIGLEAMAHGRPVVAFNVGGIMDWLKDGYNGFLVPPCDIHQLSSQIQLILNNHELAEFLGSNGLKFIEDYFSPQNYLSRLLKIFTLACR